MSEYWGTWICGFCAGGGLVFILATILANREHREWMKITEKHWQSIEEANARIVAANGGREP